MTKRETETLTRDDELPRPIVLSLEDLARVAAAGATLATAVRVGGPIIAGGLPAAGVVSATGVVSAI